MLTAPLQSWRETASPDGAMVAAVSRSLAGPTIADDGAGRYGGYYGHPRYGGYWPWLGVGAGLA